MRSSVTERSYLAPQAKARPRLDWLKAFAGRGLDVLLPPHCPCCDAAVSRQGLLCAGCFSGLSFIIEPMCDRCGVPFSSAAQGSSCPSCQETPPVFGQARAALRYDAGGRALILPLKHADRVELAPVLAPMMVRAGASLLSQADLLVPVPLHRRRLFQRKYNQAAVLALMIGKLSGRHVSPDALARTRRTSPLDDKSPEERAAAVSGSIAVRRPSEVAGRSVLLIDDVMTSGATANACAAAMLQAGAVRVDVLLAARVPDPRLR